MVPMADPKPMILHDSDSSATKNPSVKNQVRVSALELACATCAARTAAVTITNGEDTENNAAFCHSIGVFGKSFTIFR